MNTFVLVAVAAVIVIIFVCKLCFPFLNTYNSSFYRHIVRLGPCIT